MTSAIAAIHSGCKQLGIDEDARRAIYARVTGKASLKLMSPGEKEAVVGELRRLGFKLASRRPNGRARLSGKFAGKLQALWITAYNLDIVDNRDDAALEAFIRRQTGLERERFLYHASDAAKVIEALKKWIAREGGVDWTVDNFTPPYAVSPGFKVAWAQWLRMGGEVHANSTHEFWTAVHTASGENGREISRSGWQRVMNEFGRKVRARKAGAK